MAAPAHVGRGDGPWKDVGLLEQRAAEGRFTDEPVRSVRAESERLAADLDADRRWWEDTGASIHAGTSRFD